MFDARSLTKWILLAFAFQPMIAQSPTTFSGTLDGRLHVDPSMASYANWDEEPTVQEHRLPVPLQSGDRLYMGKLTLAGEPPISFDGVIILSTNGDDSLFLDTDRDGRFEAAEGHPFAPLEKPEEQMKSGLHLDVPIPSGQFRVCPMEVRLPKDGVRTPAGPKQLTVIYTKVAFVEGYARLPQRSLLVRFQYSFTGNSVDLSNGMEGVDVDGNGSIDKPGSAEQLRATGKPPIFRVGNLLLSVQSVDLPKNTFILRSVPASEYERIDLGVGTVLPDFVFTDFEGHQRHLSELKAKYILLDFWATWCGPCVASIPSQQAAYAKFHGQGFEILGMDGEASPAKAQELLSKLNVTWPQARFDEELFQHKFQISQWPTLVLIDADRRIVSAGGPQQLPLDGENLQKTLARLLDHP